MFGIFDRLNAASGNFFRGGTWGAILGAVIGAVIWLNSPSAVAGYELYAAATGAAIGAMNGALAGAGLGVASGLLFGTGDKASPPPSAEGAGVERAPEVAPEPEVEAPARGLVSFLTGQGQSQGGGRGV